ncbi:MAG: ribonuclease H-like domain-containing protein [Candidatus Aenigmatarchaeota archaeon]
MFLDIETTNTKADIGQIVAIGIIKENKKEVKFVESLEDEKEALKWLKKELEDCELVITWYGSCFDIPFIITRAIINGEDLSRLLEIPSLDLWEFCRNNLSFSKNSLQEISKSLRIPKNREIEGRDVLRLYLKAVHGDKKAKEEIVSHCLDDLEVLKEIFKKFESYLNLTTKKPWSLS